MSASPSDEDRLAKIEILLSHLQQDIDKLNEALIGQQKETMALRTLISRVESEVDQLAFPPANPLDEKPPHY
ncbi:MAG: SlyX family protein [Planctomycetaceae bacterium]|nr:SlyX family protein [Planctomycetaceae bacterium]